MKIKDRNYRVNVQVLLMEHEIDVTKITLAGLLQQLSEDDNISVLLNGSRNQEFKELCNAHTGIFYYESPLNLGVAGGRNFLLQTSVAKQADIIMFVDNDVIVPIDYIESCTKFLIKNPNAGVIGSIVLKYKNIIRFINEKTPPFDGYFGASVWPISNSDLREFTLNNSLKERLFHIGTHPDWETGYIHNADTLAQIQEIVNGKAGRQFYLALADDDQIVEQLQNPTVNLIEASNIAGCCQTFRRSLVEQIGLLNPLFSPYGFEDVDFCVRAILAGYKNYTNTESFLIHGTDNRHAVRSKQYSIHTKLRNDSRCRTILEYLRFSKNYIELATKRVSCNYILEKLARPYRAAERLSVEIAGLKDGVRQLVQEYGTDVLQTLPKNFVTYSMLSEKCEQKLKLEFLQETQGSITQRILKSKKYLGAYQKERLQNREISILTLSSNRQIEKVELEKNYSQRLRRFQNIHLGQKCFIIGNGPSLRKTDLSLLKNDIIFAVNSFYLMTDEIGIQPTYYVVEDNHVVEDNLERINQIQAKAKFFPDKYASVIAQKPNVFFMPTDWSCYFKSKPQYQNPDFSDDISKRICAGQTVTYLNLQIAYYMGFSEVYLIGLDFSYDIPKSADIEGLTIISNEDDPNHFHPSYFGKGKKWHFPKLNSCLNSYRKAKAFYEKNGTAVYNATIGGRLELFERVDYYSLFSSSQRLTAPNKTITYFLNQYFQVYSQQNKSDLDYSRAYYFLNLSWAAKIDGNKRDVEEDDILRLLCTASNKGEKVVSIGSQELLDELKVYDVVKTTNLNGQVEQFLPNLSQLKVAAIDFKAIQDDDPILGLALNIIETKSTVFIRGVEITSNISHGQGKFLSALLNQPNIDRRYMYIFNSVAILTDRDEYSFLGDFSPDNIREQRALTKANPLHILLMLNEKQFSERWYFCEIPSVTLWPSSNNNVSDSTFVLTDVGMMLASLDRERIPFAIYQNIVFFQLSRR